MGPLLPFLGLPCWQWPCHQDGLFLVRWEGRRLGAEEKRHFASPQTISTEFFCDLPGHILSQLQPSSDWISYKKHEGNVIKTESITVQMQLMHFKNKFCISSAHFVGLPWQENMQTMNCSMIKTFTGTSSLWVQRHFRLKWRTVLGDATRYFNQPSWDTPRLFETNCSSSILSMFGQFFQVQDSHPLSKKCPASVTLA